MRVGTNTCVSAGRLVGYNKRSRRGQGKRSVAQEVASLSVTVMVAAVVALLAVAETTAK